MPEHRHIAVTSGDEVYTRDGELLGVVKELHDGTHFEVDAPHARDYWLACDTLLRSSDRRVTVDFDAHDIDAYQLDEPAPVSSPDPMLDAETDDRLSESARDKRQREMKSGYPATVASPGDIRKEAE